MGVFCTSHSCVIFGGNDRSAGVNVREAGASVVVYPFFECFDAPETWGVEKFVQRAYRLLLECTDRFHGRNSE